MTKIEKDLDKRIKEAKDLMQENLNSTAKIFDKNS